MTEVDTSCRPLTAGGGGMLPRWATWALPVGIFALARVVSAVFMVALSARQPDLTHDPGWYVSGSMPAHPSYWVLATNWDGQWYQSIARNGYPTGAGALASPGTQTSLAFYPLYPTLVGLLMRLTGLPFVVVGPTFGLLLGALGMALLYRWLAITRGPAIALTAVVVLSVFPTSPAFQLAYSESLALVLLVIALRAVVERRWLVVLAAAFPLSLTRPIALPLAVVIALLEVWGPGAGDNRRRRPTRTGLVAAATVGAMTFSWPGVAALLTGRSNAYFAAEAAWVRPGGLEGGWVRGLWDVGLPVLAVLLLVVVGALVTIRWAHRHEPGWRDRLGLWAGVYMLFILSTTTLSTSVLRYALLTLVPLGGFGPMSPTLSSRRTRYWLLVAVVAVELALQYWWVANVLVVEDSPVRSRFP